MSETKKNLGGRPPVNATPVTVRVPPDMLAKLDEFCDRNNPRPSRPEAIRQIIAAAFKAME